MNRRTDRAVVALLLLAAAFRFPGLGIRSLWFDEALSGVIARMSATQVLTNVAGSSHPPGYYFVMHLWRTLGEGEYILRYPSAWCSVAAVAVVTRLGRDLFGRRVARLAALGMTLAPFQVYYAQEARMYGLAILLSSGVIWTFVRGAREGDGWAWWGYGILVALGLYVHYYVGLVVLALHLWLLLDRRFVHQVWVGLSISDALIVLAFVPQLAQFRSEAGEFLGSARWRALPHPLEPLRTLHYLLFSHIMPLWIVPAGLFLIIGLLAIGGLWAWRRRDRAVGMLALVILFPIITALIVSFMVTPVYVERSFAVVTPALMLLLARSITVVPRRSPVPLLWKGLVALMVLGAGLYHARPDPAKPPIKEALAVVERKAQGSDSILHLQDASYLSGLYYKPGAAGRLVSAGQRLWLSPQVYALFGGQVIQPEELVPVGRVWLTVMPGYVESPQRGFQDMLEAASSPVQSWDWGMSVQVRLYSLEKR